MVEMILTAVEEEIEMAVAGVSGIAEAGEVAEVEEVVETIEDEVCAQYLFNKSMRPSYSRYL